jgi:flagellar biosynthetic protein FlhB
MAEGPDRDSRTEEATEKRIQDALRDGNTPVSREAMPFAILLSGLLICVFLAGGTAEKLTGILLPLIENPANWHMSTAKDVQAHLLALMVSVGAVMLPVFLLFASVGLGASFLNGLPRVAGERIRPKLERLSPSAGWQRLFQVTSLVELAKAVFKLTVVVGIGLWFCFGQIGNLGYLIDVDGMQLPVALLSIVRQMFIYLVVFAALLLAADLVFVRLNWHKSLRMTRQQIKDEHRQAEGDPHLKMRRKTVARERARKRNLTAVPKATVIVVNPTHYAVALRYAREEGGAPVVLAKGQDLIALTIRRIAESHGIAIVEDKPLARSLYAQVEVGQQIPSEFFRAVADILLSLQKRGKIKLQ